MTLEELVAKDKKIKDSKRELDEDLVITVKQFLSEVVSFVAVKENNVHGLIFAQASELYHFWCSFLAANGVSIKEFPLSLLEVRRSAAQCLP